MCLPAAVIAATAVQAGQTGLQIAQQSAVGKQQERIHAINRGLAAENAQRAFEANAKREQQEAQATAQNIERIQRRAQQALGLTRVQAGATAGQSLGTVIRDIQAQQFGAESTAVQNFGFAREQLAAQNEAARTQQQANELQTLPTQSSTPDLLGGAFQIAAAGVNAFTQTGGFDQPQ
tara:strand:- start:479 stop:1012 length:534 start_codon:yes stop_codon:yes gene_type:complete